jgi:hypothetical protein
LHLSNNHCYYISTDQFKRGALLEQYISICHVMASILGAIAVGVGTYIGQKAVDGIANYASGFLKSKFGGGGGGGGGGRRVGGILKQILKKKSK